MFKLNNRIFVMVKTLPIFYIYSIKCKIILSRKIFNQTYATSRMKLRKESRAFNVLLLFPTVNKLNQTIFLTFNRLLDYNI